MSRENKIMMNYCYVTIIDNNHKSLGKMGDKNAKNGEWIEQ